jgi:hypothetical protein
MDPLGPLSQFEFAGGCRSRVAGSADAPRRQRTHKAALQYNCGMTLDTLAFLALVAAAIVWWQWRFGIGDAVRTARRMLKR